MSNAGIRSLRLRINRRGVIWMLAGCATALLALAVSTANAGAKDRNEGGVRIGGVTISPNGWIHYTTDLPARKPGDFNQTLRVKGKRVEGGCDLSSGTAKTMPDGVRHLTEVEAAYNPKTCESIIIRRGSKHHKHRKHRKPHRKHRKHRKSGASAPALAPAAQPSTEPLSPAERSDATHLFGPATEKELSPVFLRKIGDEPQIHRKTAHFISSYVDPLNITITSLGVGLTWGAGTGTGGGYEGAVHNYAFKYDGWEKSRLVDDVRRVYITPLPGEKLRTDNGTTYAGPAGGYSAWARQTFFNSDFAEALQKIRIDRRIPTLKLSTACTQLGKVATFRHFVQVTGYFNGKMGWLDTGDTDKDVKGACANLVHFERDVGFGAGKMKKFFVPSAMKLGSPIRLPCIACLILGFVPNGSAGDPNVAESEIEAGPPPPPAEPPTVFPVSATESKETVIKLTGSLNPNNLSTNYRFECGSADGPAESYPLFTAESVANGTAPVAALATLEGLEPDSAYRCRMIASSSAGTVAGPDAIITTPAESSPATLKTGSGELSVFQRVEGTAEAVDYERASGAWLPPKNLTEVVADASPDIASTPSAIKTASGEQLMAARNHLNELVVFQKPAGGIWTTTSLTKGIEGLRAVGSPVMVETKQGEVIVFARNDKNELVAFVKGPETWTFVSISAITPGNPQMRGNPSVIEPSSQELRVFVRNEKNELISFDRVAGAWTARNHTAVTPGNPHILGTPAPIEFTAGELTVFGRAEGSNDLIAFKKTGPESWSSENLTSGSPRIRGNPAPFLTSLGEKLVFVRVEGSNYVAVFTKTGSTSWSFYDVSANTNDQARIKASPVVVEPASNELMVFARDQNDELISFQRASPISWTSNNPGTITNLADWVNLKSAAVSGYANPNGIDTAGFFQYGLSDSYSTSTFGQSLGNGKNVVKASAVIDGLQTGTLYHYRFGASRAFKGTSYGVDQTFRTLLESPRVLMTGTQDGKLHELAYKRNRDWHETESMSPAAVAAGTTTSSLVTGTMQSTYFVSSVDGKVHEFGHNGSNGWRERNMSQQKAAAKSSPASFVDLSNVIHVYFVGEDKKIHELFLNSVGWNESPALSSTKVAAGSSPTVRWWGPSSGIRLYFVGEDNKVHSLLKANSTAGWVDSGPLTRLVATGTSPSSILTGDTTAAYYIAAEDGKVHEVAWKSGSWSDSAALSRKVATGTGLSALNWVENGRRVYYVASEDSKIHELAYTSGTWTDGAALSRTVAAGTSPSADGIGMGEIFQPTTEAAFVYYQAAEDNRIHELRHEPGVGWSDGEALSQNAAPGFSPSVSVWASGIVRVSFSAADGGLRELFYVPASDGKFTQVWSEEREVAAQKPAAGTRPTAFMYGIGEPRSYYVAAGDNKIHELAHPEELDNYVLESGALSAEVAAGTSPVAFPDLGDPKSIHVYFVKKADGQIHELSYSVTSGWTETAALGPGKVAPGTSPVAFGVTAGSGIRIYFVGEDGKIRELKTTGPSSPWLESGALSRTKVEPGTSLAAWKNASDLPRVYFASVGDTTADKNTIHELSYSGSAWSESNALTPALAAGTSPSGYALQDGTNGIYFTAASDSRVRKLSYSGSWTVSTIMSGVLAAGASPSVISPAVDGVTRVYYVGSDKRVHYVGFVACCNSSSESGHISGTVAAGATVTPFLMVE